MDVKSRARGCLLGLFAGDALGAQVEFCSKEEIRRRWPDGVREMRDGGTWQTLAGQLTDDSELALMLAHSLVDLSRYAADDVLARYQFWLQSRPFDCGNTIRAGLRGRLNGASQANGALMRIAPLGIFGANHTVEDVRQWACRDARLTHPHRVCQEVNALYAAAISVAIKEGVSAAELAEVISDWAGQWGVDDELLAVVDASHSPPEDFLTHQGWVLVAFQNTLYHLRRGWSLEEALVWTIAQGGDTDTNAAIAGAMLGAVQGENAVPKSWREGLLACRPEAGQPGVRQPRPREFWPIDVLKLADQLVTPI